MNRSLYHHARCVGYGLLAAGLLSTPASRAADHQEAPATRAQTVADIGDYYAWHDGDDLNLVLTFGTFAAPGTPAAYDSTVLYSFHFDTSSPADGVADSALHARFGQDDAGNWGVQVMGDGVTTLEGAVENVIGNADLSAWAGLADDPFFFDQSGFQDTVATGTLSFDPERDDVAGLNITAIALQLPLTTVVEAGGQFQTWATTGSE